MEPKNLIIHAQTLNRDVTLLENEIQSIIYLKIAMVNNINSSYKSDDNNLNFIVNSYYDALECIEMDTVNQFLNVVENIRKNEKIRTGISFVEMIFYLKFVQIDLNSISNVNEKYLNEILINFNYLKSFILRFYI